MTSLLATRRRAEEFARLVEGRRRTHDPNMAPLLDLVSRLTTPAPVEPSATFRRSLREELITAASAADAERTPAPAPTPVPRAPVPSGPPIRWAAVAASVVLAGGMVGTAAAARTALPGDALYGVKLGLERTEAAVTTNDQSRGREYLKQATQRLNEVVALVDETSVPATSERRLDLIDTALREFIDDAREGGALLLAGYERRGESWALYQLGEFTTQSRPKLAGVAEYLPAQVSGTHTEATRVLQSFGDQLAGICPVCLVTTAPVPSGQSGADSDESGSGPDSEVAAGAVPGDAQPAPPSRPDGGNDGGNAGGDNSGNVPVPPDADERPGPDGPRPEPTDRPQPTPPAPEPPNPPDEPEPDPTWTIGLPNPVPEPTVTPGPGQPSPEPTDPSPERPRPGKRSFPLPLPDLPLPKLPLPPILTGNADREPEPTPSPSPTESPSPTPTRPPIPSPTDTPTDGPTPSPQPSDPGDDTVEPTPTPTDGPTPDPSPTPTRTPSPEGPGIPPSLPPTIVPEDRDQLDDARDAKRDTAIHGAQQRSRSTWSWDGWSAYLG